jgi:AraC-like DNA-binding protein
MARKVVDAAARAPAPQLAPLIDRYSGIRYEGFAPGTHAGLPSRSLTVAISLDDPLLIEMPGRPGRPASFTALAAGLHAGAVAIAHDGSQSSVSLELTPTGARSLLGLPAAELAGTVVHLDELLGRESRRLVERLAAAPDWEGRFAVLDDVLTRRAGRLRAAEACTTRAWDRIVSSGGAARIGELATEIGYSRRHLTERFAREYGMTPKQVARIVRFERSWRLLQEELGRTRPRRGAERPSLARVAARCGYYDQAHMAREWKELAGRPASAWLAEEELAFVQDSTAEHAVASPT